MVVLEDLASTYLSKVVGDLVEDLRVPPESEAQTTSQACPRCGYRLRLTDAHFFGWRRGPEGLVYTICPACGSDWPD
jgi:rRNA maturation protein Nop10